jgi:hypothetical protein
MKTLLTLLFCCMTCYGFSGDFPKGMSIGISAGPGVTFIPHEGIQKYGYTIEGTFQKTYSHIQITAGVQYSVTSDNKVFLSNPTNELFVKYKSIGFPVGVTFKYGHQSNRIFPVIAAAIGPAFNFKSSVFSIRPVGVFFDAKAGVGFNLIKLLSLELGANYHGSLTTITKGEKKKPMVAGAFIGLNVNL